MTTIMVIGTVANVIHQVWVWSGLTYLLSKLLRPPGLSVSKFLGTELKPLYLPAVAIDLSSRIIRLHLPPWQVAVSLTVSLFCWWVYKDVFNDDDRWKRRRKKIKESIKRIGSRLVPVPSHG